MKLPFMGDLLRKENKVTLSLIKRCNKSGESPLIFVEATGSTQETSGAALRGWRGQW